MNKKNTYYYTKDEGCKRMSPIESIELEKTSYVREMKEYLHNLQQLSPADAQRVSFQNLLNCGIIEENGKFSRRYMYSRKNEENKR